MNLPVTMTIFGVQRSVTLPRITTDMKTTILLLIVFVCAASTASAQAFRIGPGLEYASPLGTFGDRVSEGFGGVGQVKLDLPFISVLGAVDYIRFSEREIISTVGANRVTTKTSAEMWGLNAGATLGLFPFVYGGAEVGTYFVTARTEVSGSGTETKLTRGSFAPLLGVSLGIVDISARYVFLQDSDFLLLRGVVFF